MTTSSKALATSLLIALGCSGLIRAELNPEMVSSERGNRERGGLAHQKPLPKNVDSFAIYQPQRGCGCRRRVALQRYPGTSRPTLPNPERVPHVRKTADDHRHPEANGTPLGLVDRKVSLEQSRGRDILIEQWSNCSITAQKADSPKPFFGPRKRAIITAFEVKVQSVATSVPTPSGSNTVFSLDLQQPTEFGTGLADMLTTALVESKRFIVLDRQSLEDLAKEKALDPTATKDPVLPAQVMIKGSVTELSFKRSGAGGNLTSSVVDGSAVRSVATVAIDLKIIDVETGQVLDSIRAEGRVSSSFTSLNLTKGEFKLGIASFDNGPLGKAVRSAIDDGVKKICDRTQQIPWQAKVADVTDDEIYLNAGATSGLLPGDILEITRPGAEIRDPDTKLVIGRKKGKRIGQCKVQSIEPNLTIAIPTEGKDFQKDDVATFLKRPKQTRETVPLPRASACQ